MHRMWPERKPALIQIAAAILILAALTTPRYASIRTYITIDEHTWLTRSANFATALRTRAYAETSQSEHPGVTVMWIGALAQSIFYPDYAGHATENISLEAYEADLRERFGSPLPLLVASRALTIAVIGLCLGASLLLLQKLAGGSVAILSLLFVALDPFTVAHTQLLHLDGLLSALVLLAYLALLRYLTTRRWPLLVLSGAAAGLAFLTKSTALLALPGIALTLLVSQFQHPHDADRQGGRRGWKRQATTLLLWSSIAAATVFLLWPALWTAPLDTLTHIVEGALSHAESGHETPIFYAGRIIESGQIGAGFYPAAYIWRSTPVAVIGLLGALGALVFGWRASLAEDQRRLLGYLLLLSCSFLVFVSFGAKKFDRYMLPMWLPLLLISALGWSSLIDRILRSFANTSQLTRWVATAAVVGLHGSCLLSVYPYPLSYYSPLLGGHERAAQYFTVGWGDGLDQAAAYLNTKPDAQDLSVVSWYGPCLSYLFAGETHNIPNAADISPEHVEILLEQDYVVTYINQWQRKIPASLHDRPSGWCHEHSVYVNEVEYARIYSRQDCSEGPNR